MNNKGFSIIELLVTMGIVGIISVIVFANYRSMGRETILSNEADAVISYIEKARTSAVSATKMEEGGDQVDYFTIDIEEDALVLYADTNNQRAARRLENRIKIKSAVGYRIGFKPPEPEVVFWDENNNEITDRYIDIEVGYPEGDEEDITVRVNKVGLIRKIE